MATTASDSGTSGSGRRYRASSRRHRLSPILCGLGALVGSPVALAGTPSSVPPEPAFEHALWTVALAVGHATFRRAASDERAPSATYLDASATYRVAPLLRPGLQASVAVDPFGCDSDETCYAYSLTRLGAVLETRVVLVGDSLQGLEPWARVAFGPAVTSTRAENDRTPRDTPWGVHATAQLGAFVRMRSLVLGPYFEAVALSIGHHAAYGWGIRAGLQF